MESRRGRGDARESCAEVGFGIRMQPVSLPFFLHVYVACCPALVFAQILQHPHERALLSGRVCVHASVCLCMREPCVGVSACLCLCAYYMYHYRTRVHLHLALSPPRAPPSLSFSLSMQYRASAGAAAHPSERPVFEKEKENAVQHISPNTYPKNKKIGASSVGHSRVRQPIRACRADQGNGARH